MVGGSLAVIMLAAGVSSASAAPPTAPTPPQTAAKIEPSLARELKTSGDTDFWVRLEARADLTAASATEDWAQRGTRVAAELRATAAASQAAVRAELDSAGVDYTAFWATNAIHVRAGSEDLATSLAARPDVDAVRAETQYVLPTPDESSAVRAANAVEWGIANINADDVWSQYGVRGAGITVANIDTGVQYDHPALVGQYRGNKGDGTFDHNYNWFDAAGACAEAAPCDWNGHGTHTMGTMAGDDGADNHIGVAPGVRWIAANGCCPSDEALVRSAQWLLEPTDLAGQNPDAGLRPHVINNSWGTQVPSNDPFMEDVSAAWTASGIFAVWSNGNNAPGCRTAGSPGSRIINYSVGAYDENHRIAGFSSRGTGQDGETKPNISAPGVNVRSALPGSKYGAYNGTSMAAPHVAGTVALLWSGAPSMIGDLAGTREMLDGTAVDTPNDECGGTDEDNNVFGEGRLDALALLDTAPVGETGVLRARITGNGGPVAGATITLDGPNDRERVTGPDGTLTLPLRVGDYTMTVTAFGYADQTRTFTVATGKESTVDVSLRALRTVTVSGKVLDGSGQGWPLYAKITVPGMPGGVFHTNPRDGSYRITLPADGKYVLKVESRYDGYQAVTEEVATGRRDVRRDVRMSVDVASCTAPGYRVGHEGLQETFDNGQPDGWTVLDNLGTGLVWRFDDPGKRTNRTGSDGGFAIMDSEFYGYPNTQDTTLVSPAVDLTGQSAPAVSFWQEYDDGVFDVASVDVSYDDGASWENVLAQSERVRGPKLETIELPKAANQQKVRVRFHFVVEHSSDWWQVDDVRIGTRLCLPVSGGLVVGHVTDKNTGQVVNGATVSTVDRPAESAVTEATPDDPSVADGFYSLFSTELGRQRYTATYDEYQTATETPRLSAHKANWVDFALPAGRLSVRDVSATVAQGRSTERTLTVTNTGTAPATVEFSERTGSVTMASPAATGSTQGAPVRRVKGDFSPLALGTAPAAPASRDHYAPPSAPWVNLPSYPISIMDNMVGDLDGAIYSVGGVDGQRITEKGYVLRPGAQDWEPIADLPQPLESPSGAFIDGQFYVSGGWGSNMRATKTTYAYDPSTNTWRTLADGPVIGAAAGRTVHDGKLYLVGGCTNACDHTAVRRYDPASDTWEVLADYPEPTAHLACAPLKGQIYCAGGIRRGGITWKTTYAYDLKANTWTRKADMPFELWGMAYTGSYDRLIISGGITADDTLTNESFAYDPDDDRWTRLPASNNVVYRGGSTCGLTKVGGSNGVGFQPVTRNEMLPTYGACTPQDVPWLTVDQKKVTLKPGERVRVTVGFTATTPGTHHAGIWLKENTPYLAHPATVTMHVRRTGRP
ncbi:peptidase S8 [Actinophytocola xinjiangensis]|uniref:Peptidase S8 n=1 Tax=Actinophytocola xinjiangensis TaxID=485602 RepID=A0A7Z1AUZ9_9PSEU|nr:peptidase S8 [Actinophytocola xinjiangensis]